IGFTLPKNVYLIGTMNTADRSIALVDAAMRRRFAFVSLHPSQPPTQEVLRRWLAASERDGAVADLLDELNRLIEDPDFKIGPSYFMRAAVYEPGGLERTWRTAILPLLEEHHYGDGVDVGARYGLSTIRTRVEGRAQAQTGTPGGAPADPA
ncbi:MAG: AAA family ATPase, partial [Brooklawnia sp.]|nr:AAA family ATPase [Brooklawnia sp.]